MIFYISLITGIYSTVLIKAYYNTTNVYHAFSWIATLCALSYVLFTIHVLLFVKKLYRYSIDYVLMEGSNYNLLRQKINKHYYESWNSICHLSHIR